MGAIAPVFTAITTGAKVLGAVSTVAGLLGDSEEPSYSALPSVPESADAVEAPALATEDTSVQADAITSEELARQRALRRKKADQQRMYLSPKDSSSSSTLTASLFGE